MLHDVGSAPHRGGGTAASAEPYTRTLRPGSAMHDRLGDGGRARLRGWAGQVRRTILLGAIAVTAACGARTGLRAACVIPVDPTPPAVVVISNREAGSDDENPPGWVPQAVQVALWERVLPSLDGVAWLGGVVRPDPFNGGWPCDHVAPLSVPVGPDHSAAVVADLRARPLDRRFAAVGVIGVRATLLNAAAELRRVAAPGAARFILLTHTGLACSQVEYEEGAELGADGLRTFVISIDGRDPVSTAWLLNHLAVAGGVPRPDDPARYYDARSPETLERALADTVLAAYFCRGQPRVALRVPARATLRAAGATAWTLARDVAHVDGWDWVEAGARVEVFGASCRRVVAARAALTLIEGADDCSK